MQHARLLQALSVALAACSGRGESEPPVPDSVPVPVVALSSCPTVVDATVVDAPTLVVPATTSVGVRGLVKLDIDAEHFVIPHRTQPTDPALMVARGETKCFRFDVAGTYHFVCGVHGFVGKIVVQ